MSNPLESQKNVENPEVAEGLLSKLRKKAESAVTDEEKKKYSSLIQKLEETLANKTEVAKEGTKDILARFKSGLSPDQKSLLESAEKGVGSSVQKASEMAKEAKNAIENGDVKAAATTAGAVVTEKTEGFVKKFSEAKGLEKLDVIREAGTTVMEKIGQFFAFLFSFLSFDSSKIKDAWNTLIGVPKDVADAVGKGKEIVESGIGNKVLKPIEEAYAKVREAQKSKNPQLIAIAVKEYRDAREKIKATPFPENQKKWLADVERTIGSIEGTIKETVERFKETNLPKFTKYISDEFYGGAKLPDHMLKDIGVAFNKVHYGQDTIDEIARRINDKSSTELAKTHDIGKFLAEIIFKNKESLFALLSVIPVKRWVWNVTKKTVSEGANAYWMNASLIFGDGTSSIPVEFSRPELVKFIEKTKSDELKRNILLMQFYRVNGVFATMLGVGVAGAWGGVNMLLDNSHKVDGLKTFTYTWQKNYSALADEVSVLEKAFGETSKFSMATSMRNSLQSIKQNFLLLSLLEESKRDPIVLKKLLRTENYKELTTIFKLSAEEIDRNAKNLGPFFGGLMKVNADTFKLSTPFSKILSTDTGVAQEFLEKCASIQGFQRRLATRSAGEIMKTFGGSFEILTLPRYADRVLLRFKNMETAEKTLRQLSSYGGQTLGGLLKGLPVAGLVVGGVSLANHDMKTEEKIKSFGKLATQALVPVVGPITLFFDDEVGMKINKETYEVENLGIGVVAIGTATFEGFMLTKALGKGGLAGAGKYMMGPITDAVHLTKTITTGVRAIGKATPRIVNPKWIVEGVEMFGKVPRYGKYIAGLLLAIGGGYLYMKNTEDLETTLAGKGLWDKNTGDLTPKALQEFAKMDDLKKKEFCDTLLHQFVEKGANPRLPNAKSHIENGVYSIVVNNQAEGKMWWEAILAKRGVFGDEFNRLGVCVDVVNVESAKQGQEKTKVA